MLGVPRGCSLSRTLQWVTVRKLRSHALCYHLLGRARSAGDSRHMMGCALGKDARIFWIFCIFTPLSLASACLAGVGGAADCCDTHSSSHSCCPRHLHVPAVCSPRRTKICSARHTTPHLHAHGAPLQAQRSPSRLSTWPTRDFWAPERACVGVRRVTCKRLRSPCKRVHASALEQRRQVHVQVRGPLLAALCLHLLRELHCPYVTMSVRVYACICRWSAFPTSYRRSMNCLSPNVVL